MLIERLKKGADRPISYRESPLELEDHDRSRSKAGFQGKRSTLRWENDLTVEPRAIALWQIGKIGSDIRACRAVVTFDRDAPNLQGETLDGLLGMERPSRNGHRIVIYDVGKWKVGASY